MSTAHRGTVNALRVERAAPRGERAASLVAILAFLSVVGVLSYRGAGNLNIPGHPDATRWVLQDFRDAIYYPVAAFLAGDNPYDADVLLHRYPVGRPLPLYSPLSLLIHAPFAVVPFEAAELAYYLLSVLLTVLLARLCLEYCGISVRTAYVFGLATLLLLSRPGQMNLLLGQVALQCVIATYVALHYARTRPWLAAFGLALSTFKPTFGVPLAVLMLCRRDTRAVLIGLTIAGVLSAAGAGVLLHAAGSAKALLASLLVSHQGFTSQLFNDALSAPFRVDTPALVTRALGIDLGDAGELIVGLAVLSFGAFATWRAASQEHGRSDIRPMSATLTCLTILACTYHQTYDWLLLALPVTALATNRLTPRGTLRPVLRWVLLAVLLLPAVNYLATATAIEQLEIADSRRLLVTSLNAGALLFALAMCARLAVQSADAVRLPRVER
jgi:hypothetical protein